MRSRVDGISVSSRRGCRLRALRFGEPGRSVSDQASEGRGPGASEKRAGLGDYAGCVRDWSNGWRDVENGFVTVTPPQVKPS